MLYDETTGTLLCGDLFTAMGECDALTTDDIVEPALAAEEAFRATALTPTTAPTIHALAELKPTTIGLMHGPSFRGDGAKALTALAEGYDRMFEAANN